MLITDTRVNNAPLVRNPVIIPEGIKSTVIEGPVNEASAVSSNSSEKIKKYELSELLLKTKLEKEADISELVQMLCSRELADPRLPLDNKEFMKLREEVRSGKKRDGKDSECRNHIQALRAKLGATNKNVDALIFNAMQSECESPKSRVMNELISPFYNVNNITENPEILEKNLQSLKYQFERLMIDNANVLAAGDPVWGEELADKHWESIGATRDNYLEIFLKSFEKMNGFYEDFIAFKNKIPDWIMGTDDKGNVSFNNGEFNKEIQALIDKYSSPSPDAQLYPGEGQVGTKEECENWIKQMGLSPTNCLVQKADGSWAVTIDISALKNIQSSAPDGKQSAAKFSAWESAFNSQGDTLQNNMQMFTQKMSSANSIYENLIKIFSSFIEQDLNAARSFLNF
jgi:type III secretion system IpaD/SipD/SspD family effector